MRETMREILQGVEYDQDKKPKILENNTVEYWQDGEKHIRFHHTDIIIFKANGDIVLNSGSWKTPTTKERLNKYLNNYQIFTDKGIWYLYNKKILHPWSDKDARHIVFADGITLHKDGKITGQGDDPKITMKYLTQIKKYADEYIAALVARKVPQPGPGDCWLCSFKDSSGETWGEKGHNPDHILSHFKERYFVPSLLMNAIEAYPVAPITKSCIGYWMKYHEQELGSIEEFGKEQVKKSLIRYLKRQFGIAS